ncbi:putative actin [Trypanosoma theileri]|uniref:Putative actin n=1 Tax=Trypanosoma theileri TaxID=67003 RepID=A0A1X0PA74_9TRYP|nr:putative actin [Trypanosoma theileri]ORC93788.1 putative actin [Trypanosoma theileri]
MAVVEVGWNIRAGYIGDVKCTRQISSLHSQKAPTETCLPSTLVAADAAGIENLVQMWTLQSLEQEKNLHMDHLMHIMGKELGCLEEDPLMLVVPEMWHEKSEVIQNLFRLILESNFTSALYCCRPSVAWTLASGKTSAVVLDVGHHHSTATAVLDGYALRGTIVSNNLAGSVVTQRLMDMIGVDQLERLESLKHYRLPSVREWAFREMCGDIKRVACSVRTGRSDPSRKEEPLLLRAPDGNTITVTANARLEPYDVLFGSPNGTGESLADLLVQCKRCLDPEWQQQTISHILCGGTSQASGFRERLLKETRQRDSSYFRYGKEDVFKVFPAVDGAWAGASLAADCSSFSSLWVTRTDFEEEGDSILYRKLLC